MDFLDDGTSVVKLSPKLYHKNELEVSYQQRIAEAPKWLNSRSHGGGEWPREWGRPRSVSISESDPLCSAHLLMGKDQFAKGDFHRESN